MERLNASDLLCFLHSWPGDQLKFRQPKGQSLTVDGRNPAPLGNHGKSLSTGESNHSRVSERWCEMDFIHPLVPISTVGGTRGFSRLRAH